MTCPTPEYCGVNGCSNAACHPSRRPPATFFFATGDKDALPGVDDDRRFFAAVPRETPTPGIGRAVLACAAVALAVGALLAALAGMLS